MIRFALVALAALFLAGCNLSQDTCDTLDAVKASFDRFAAAGEFDARTVVAVNGVYASADAACENPGTVSQVQMIVLATDAIFVIRQAMNESEAAYAVLGPQIRNLESALERARQLE